MGQEKESMSTENLMGQMYIRGDCVTQSYEMAKRLLEQAAQQGDINAILALGDMYYQGLGVEVSYERAFEDYMLMYILILRTSCTVGICHAMHNTDWVTCMSLDKG